MELWTSSITHILQAPYVFMDPHHYLPPKLGTLHPSKQIVRKMRNLQLKVMMWFEKSFDQVIEDMIIKTKSVITHIHIIEAQEGGSPHNIHLSQ